MRNMLFAKLSLLALVIVFVSYSAIGQMSTFTYQGKLNDGGTPANGQYDFVFKLFPTVSGGSQIGADVARDNVQVTNGVFSVNLDFGVAAFATGAANYLEIQMRPGASTGAYTLLAPRQLITSSPYSVKSLLSDTAQNTAQLGGISASGFIQNTTSQQTSSNFNISGNGVIGGNLGIGTAPGFKLDVAGRIRLRQNLNDTGNINTAGIWLFQNTPNIERAFVGMQDDNNVGFYGTNGGWGLTMDTITGNVGIGTVTPSSKLSVSGTGGIRANVNSDSNAGLGLSLNNQPKWSVATVTPGQFQIFNDAIGANAFWIDPTNNNVGIGTSFPSDKLVVSGSGVVRTRINSNSEPQLTFSINNQPQWTLLSVFGQVGGNYLVIKNETTGIDAVQITPDSSINIAHFANGGDTITCNYRGILAYCSSSLRYKTNIAPFGSGLNLVKQLAPITFNWKQSGMKDFGLGAEDVEKIEPLLVTYNDKGEVEGVKYERIGVVLINAVKEQQTQIAEQTRQNESLQKQLDEQREIIKRQQTELAALKSLICPQNPSAEICKSKD